jgi:hypothetical protein
MKPFTALAICAVVAACESLPKSHYFAPQVSGVVQTSGTPVPNARVLLASEFTTETQITRTDAGGMFSVGPLTNFQFTVRQVGDPVYRYELHIAVGGKEVQAFYQEGAGDPPRKIVLVCELSAAVPVGRGGGYCSPR